MRGLRYRDGESVDWPDAAPMPDVRAESCAAQALGADMNDASWPSDILTIARDADALGEPVRAATIRAEIAHVPIFRIYDQVQGSMTDPPRGACLGEVPGPAASAASRGSLSIVVPIHADGDARGFRLTRGDELLMQGDMDQPRLVAIGDVVTLAISIAPP